MQKTSLEDLLKYEFHNSLFENFIGLKEYWLAFLSNEEHLYINALNFPDISFKVLSPGEVAGYIPKSLVLDYMSYTVAYSSVIVYHISNELCFFENVDFSNNDQNNKISNAQDETFLYLKAYENGLLKEAYMLAKKTETPVIFSIVNGQAQLLNYDEASSLIKQYPEEFPEPEEWEFLATDSDLNPSLVSFIYIDAESDTYWYDVLSTEYEADLFKKWGW